MVICGQEFEFSLMNANDLDRFEDANERMQRRSAEEAEQERISKWKRKGLLLNDEDVLQAMEPGDAPKRMCYSVKKDGTISGDLADRQQLKLLEGYVFRILSRLVEDIVSGNVEPNPYTRGSTHDACRFCPYGPVCHPAASDSGLISSFSKSKQLSMLLRSAGTAVRV